jgi:hypothetical protein
LRRAGGFQVRGQTRETLLFDEVQILGQAHAPRLLGAKTDKVANFKLWLGVGGSIQRQITMIVTPDHSLCAVCVAPKNNPIHRYSPELIPNINILSKIYQLKHGKCSNSPQDFVSLLAI